MPKSGKIPLRVFLTLFNLAAFCGCAWLFFSSFPGYNGALDNIGLGALPLGLKVWASRIVGAIVFFGSLPIVFKNIRAVWKVDDPWEIVPKD